MSNPIWDRNLLVLSTKNPELARDLTLSNGADYVSYIFSKLGNKIPVFNKNGSPKPLHSRFDPQKEAARLIEHHNPKDYICVFGLAGGYHIAELLKKDSVKRVFIFEQDLPYLKFLFEEFDFQEILLDPRVSLICDVKQEDLAMVILNDYLPILYGDLQLLPLRSRMDLNQEYFFQISDIIRNMINPIADDYTVQSYFGKQWYRNTLINLKSAVKSSAILKPIRKATIIGAGPSIEFQLRNIDPKSTILCTDTALPALLARNIEPHIVITMDCQSISYHHFLQGFPKEIPLVLDLASPPALSKLSDKPIFFSSGHPLSQYASAYLREFPSIDTSGGNISHAAISLAYNLGAREIEILGTDFSYPEGKPYARGTYVYPYFDQRAKRTNPTLSQSLNFVFRNSKIILEKDGEVLRYTTKPMINYKQRLEEFLNSLDSQIRIAPSKGVKININKQSSREDSTSNLFCMGPLKQDVIIFLKRYLNALENHTFFTHNTHYSDLSNQEKDLLMTILPTAAVLQRKETPESLSAALNWCTNQIKRQLS